MTGRQGIIRPIEVILEEEISKESAQSNQN